MKKTMIKVKPADGFKVRKPDGDFLRESGEMVEANTYWRRRLKFGEIKLVANSPEEKKEAPKKIEKKEEAKKKVFKKKTKIKKEGE